MFNKDFYPTPDRLIDKMVNHIDFRTIRTVLEPSAGKGDMVKYINNKINNANSRYNSNKINDIDCIEIDPNLQHILKGKNFRLVHDDFLTFDTYKKYDLIIANFPFSEGDGHLLKALELQQRSGGQIVCLINAETLKNPYSHTRKDLVRKLEEYDAQIEYLQDEFIDAERITSVEIALIKLDIPKPDNKTSIILDKMKQDEKLNQHYTTQQNDLIDGDFVIGAIQQYNHEIKAGLHLITEYEKLKPYMLREFDSGYSTLKLLVDDYDMRNNTSMIDLINGYIQKIRYKYWKALFNSDEFSRLLTEKMRTEYHEKLRDLQNYDFSIYNINQIRADISKHLVGSLEDAILGLFEDFTHKYNYSEYSKNIHMYNGWKTNKAYKINKKVIIPLNGYSRWTYTDLDYDYKVKDRLADIEKVFDYLDGGQSDHIDLIEILNKSAKEGISKKIQLKHFEVTFFKKGTCHILFTNDELLQKFNIFGSQKKGWLPPNYGKASYSNMTQDEKKVVDEFEGKESYNNTVANADYFLFNASSILQLDNTVA